jgi:hypothetical protein
MNELKTINEIQMEGHRILKDLAKDCFKNWD